MSDWGLTTEFIKSDMDRIDNDEYFMKDLTCTEILKFFSQIETIKEITENREEINMFFDRFLRPKEGSKAFYIELKWIAVLHQVIQNYKENTPLYGYTLKALQIYIENLVSYQEKEGPFEAFLMSALVKPYIQYLCKLCLLNMPDETSKYDESSVLDLETRAEEDIENVNPCKEFKDSEEINLKLMDWYRKYNFLMMTVETFEQILTEMQRFFSVSFPFLNNIGKLITKDLHVTNFLTEFWIFKLKYAYRGLKKSHVTVIELDQIETKIKSFSKAHSNYLEECPSGLESRIEDYSKQDIKEFLESPLKSNQIRLFAKRSLESPLQFNLHH